MDQNVRDLENDEHNENETNDIYNSEIIKILFGDTDENNSDITYMAHSFESDGNYDADNEKASYQKWCEKHNKY